MTSAVDNVLAKRYIAIASTILAQTRIYQLIQRSMAACLRFTRRVWRSFLEHGGHDLQCFPNLLIRHAIPGVVRTQLLINKSNLNRVGTVHGGLILSLTDSLGSLAVATHGKYLTGVSTNIGATFVKPAGRVGDALLATASVTSMGRSLAFTRVDFTNAAGELVAYGHHTKYIAKSAHPNDVKFSENGENCIEGQEID